MNLSKRCLAELIGTAWLVLGGCGSTVLAATFPYDARLATTNNSLGLGFLGVALAFGLTVTTMAYTIGHVSGCHLNPAVSLGLWASKRFPGSDLLPYIVAQVLGGILGAGLVYLFASGRPDFILSGSNPMATNGFGAHSPGGYGLVTAFVAEAVLTFMFLMVILGSTDHRAPRGYAPIAIGLTLTLIHLISLPITNTSVNPARSLGPALLVGGQLLEQVWLFWVAPILGAVLAGRLYFSIFRNLSNSDQQRLRELV
jgi:aquaporin Z